MNSENSRTPEPHILKLKLTHKLDLRLDKTVITLSNLSIYYEWNNIKSLWNNNKLKILAPTWNEEFTLPVDHIQYLIFRITSNILWKTWRKNDKNKPSVKIYINKNENRITFKIKNGYSLELLTKETMKILGVLKIK